MHGTFTQKVILTLVIAFFASCLVEFYKNIIQGADNDLNGAWRTNPPGAATPHP